MSRRPHRNKGEHAEIMAERQREYQRVMQAAVAIRPRLLTELMHITGLKRTAMFAMIGELHAGGLIHAKRTGRQVFYVAGPGPLPNKRNENRPELAERIGYYGVVEKPVARDPTHRRVTFGDLYPSRPGLTSRSAHYGTGSTLNWNA